MDILMITLLFIFLYQNLQQWQNVKQQFLIKDVSKKGTCINVIKFLTTIFDSILNVSLYNEQQW